MARQCSDCNNWTGEPVGAQFCKVGKRFRNANDGACCFYNKEPREKRSAQAFSYHELGRNTA